MKNKSAILLSCFVTLYQISFGQQSPYMPLRIQPHITLDGKLDETDWQLAEVENDFMQFDPVAGTAPTEKTEVRILYNNEYLFVGVRAYDRESSKIIRYALERDFEVGRDDGIAFIIDTYNDKTTGLVFLSNTLGAKYDSEIAQDGSDENISYNTFWDVATKVDSSGYSTEFRIPFSSLRFESKETVTMGFRVVRLIKRNNEFDIFPKCNPEIQGAPYKVSLAREMEFKHLKSHTPFYITSYAVANYYEENVLSNDGSFYEKNTELMTRKNYSGDETIDKIISNIGVDVKYGLTKNFTLDLTLNTDFAQVEVDNRIINLSKYEVNLPEKRSFFLESQNDLSFGFASGNQMFISRSIGREIDLIVPIIAGARVTGKSHGWRMGALNMQTRGINELEIEPHNYFVFRTRKDIDSLGSFTGGIFTNRINTGKNNLSNQCMGIDIVKKFNEHLILEVGIAATTINADFNSIGNSSYYSAGLFRDAREGLTYNATVDFLGKDFNPVMGYVDANDYGLLNGGAGYHWKAKAESHAAYLYVTSNEQYRYTLSSGKRESFSSDFFAGITFKSGADINLSLAEYKIDSLFENFILDEHNAIAAGTYKMFNNTINITAPQKSSHYGTFTSTYGDFYGGKRFYISPTSSFNFSKHFSVGLTYEYNHIKFPAYLLQNGITIYETNLIRLNIAYLMSTKFSIKLFTQYDDLSHQVSTNLRLRYNPKEGTDLFVLVNQGLNTSRTRLEPHLPMINNQAVIVKFLKTFTM